MEKTFENHSRVTAKIIEEFAWNRSKGIRLFAKIMMVVYLAGLAVTVINIIREKALNPTSLIFLVVAGCMLIYMWYGPHRAAKKSVAAMEMRCGGEIPETVLSFGEEIVSDSPMGKLDYTYDEIQTVMSLKRSYILVMDGGKGLPVCRTGFTQGTFEEFKDFLREKCPDLRIPE